MLLLWFTLEGISAISFSPDTINIVMMTTTDVAMNIQQQINIHIRLRISDRVHGCCCSDGNYSIRRRM